MKICFTALVVGIIEKDELVLPFLLTGMPAEVAFFYRLVAGPEF